MKKLVEFNWVMKGLKPPTCFSFNANFFLMQSECSSKKEGLIFWLGPRDIYCLQLSPKREDLQPLRSSENVRKLGKHLFYWISNLG